MLQSLRELLVQSSFHATASRSSSVTPHAVLEVVNDRISEHRSVLCLDEYAKLVNFRTDSSPTAADLERDVSRVLCELIPRL